MQFPFFLGLLLDETIEAVNSLSSGLADIAEQRLDIIRWAFSGWIDTHRTVTNTLFRSIEEKVTKLCAAGRSNTSILADLYDLKSRVYAYKAYEESKANECDKPRIPVGYHNMDDLITRDDYGNK